MGQRSFRYDRMTVTVIFGYLMLASSLGMNSVLSQLREQFQMSAVLTSLHGAFFGWGLLACGLSGRRLVSTFGRRRLGAGALALMGGGAAAFALGRSVAVTLPGALGIGLGCAVVVLVIPSIISDYYGPAQNDVFSVTNAYPLLIALSFPLVVGLATHWDLGWRKPYLALNLVVMIMAFTIGRGAPVPEAAAAHADEVGVVALAGQPVARTAWFFLVAMVTVEFSFNMWSTPYVREIGHVSAAMAPVITAVQALGMGLCRLFQPALNRRFAPEVLLRRCLAVAVVGPLVFWASPASVFGVVALFVTGVALAPLYVVGVDRLFRSSQAPSGTVSAAGALASGTAITLGPVILGYVADQVGLHRAMLLPVILAALTLVAWRSQGPIAIPALVDRPMPVGQVDAAARA